MIIIKISCLINMKEVLIVIILGFLECFVYGQNKYVWDNNLPRDVWSRVDASNP